MIAHARCESVSSSVSLGFCMALVDKSWTCESGKRPFANAPGSAVRVFFCCGGVIGVRSAAALRACLASTVGPPGACASSKPSISSASSSSWSQSSGSCSTPASASNAAPPSWERIADDARVALDSRIA